MENRKTKKMIQNVSYLYMLIGIVLILAVSLIQGFLTGLVEAINHIINDFTNQLLVHLYIVGFILLIVGVYIFIKERG